MNNQREIYEALLAGETLVDSTDIRLRINDAGVLINAKTGMPYSWLSGNPDNWQIHKEEKWYENIPDGGVLCKDCNANTMVINEYSPELAYNNHFKAEDGKWYQEATPLNKQEISVFMDNAPEESK